MELRSIASIESNLLAHHLDVLENAGFITRSQSSGDGRRRYVRLLRSALDGLLPTSNVSPQRVLFVCTANSARSQIAAALWRRATGQEALSAGTHPARSVHPRAIEAAARVGLDLSTASPVALDTISDRPELVITVCDRAHEELGDEDHHLHWSIPDPVGDRSRRAFDEALAEISRWIDAVTTKDLEMA